MNGIEINKPAVDLLFELIDEPADPKYTWVVSNEPNSGLLGTFAGVTAEEASRPPAPGRKTAAAHASHVRFALDLATERLLGTNPPADWDGSWEPSSVTPAQWDRLREQVRDASARLRQVISGGAAWEPLAFKGIIGTVAHTAYHLGALRQILSSRAPRGT